MEEYKIKKEDEHIRLDKIIGKIRTDISRTAIQRMIEEGNILVNGKKVRTSYKAIVEDTITIKDEKPKEIDILPQEMPLDVIYEDDHIIVVNKPSGLLTIATEKEKEKTLYHIVYLE